MAPSRERDEADANVSQLMRFLRVLPLTEEVLEIALGYERGVIGSRGRNPTLRISGRVIWPSIFAGQEYVSPSER